MSVVNVKTSPDELGKEGIGILIGIGAVAVGAVWYAKDKSDTIMTLDGIVAILSVVIVAILLWLLLTDVEKLGKLLVANQLVAIVLGCILGLHAVNSGLELLNKAKKPSK